MSKNNIQMMSLLELVNFRSQYGRLLVATSTKELIHNERMRAAEIEIEKRREHAKLGDIIAFSVDYHHHYYRMGLLLLKEKNPINSKRFFRQVFMFETGTLQWC